MIDCDAIGLVNKSLAYCFKEARLAIEDLELNKHVGQVSTIMRAVRSKDGDLLSRFDKNDESEAQVVNTSLKNLLVKNDGIAANKGRVKGQLPLE